MSTKNTGEIMTLREVSKKYDLPDSTLRDWIEAGVFGKPGYLPTQVYKGRSTRVCGPKEIERLERFLLLRKWFGGELQIIEIVTILEDMDNPDNAESAIEVLRHLEQRLEGALHWVRERIQSLYAIHFGEEYSEESE